MRPLRRVERAELLRAKARMVAKGSYRRSDMLTNPRDFRI